MRLIKELIHRRIPHIIGSYLIAGTSLILFVDWLVNRYTLPEYYTTLCLFGVIAIMPSVVILAYFHGAPGRDEWTKIEKIGVPVNIIFILLVLLIGHRSHWWYEKKDAVVNNNYLFHLTSNVNDIKYYQDAAQSSSPFDNYYQSDKYSISSINISLIDSIKEVVYRDLTSNYANQHIKIAMSFSNQETEILDQLYHPRIRINSQQKDTLSEIIDKLCIVLNNKYDFYDGNPPNTMTRYYLYKVKNLEDNSMFYILERAGGWGPALRTHSAVEYAGWRLGYTDHREGLSKLIDKITTDAKNKIYEKKYGSIIGKVIEQLDHGMARIKQYEPGIIQKNMLLGSMREYTWSEGGVDILIDDYMLFLDYLKNTDKKIIWEFYNSDSLEIKKYNPNEFKKDIDESIAELNSIIDEIKANEKHGYYDKSAGMNTKDNSYDLEVIAVEDSIIIAKVIGSKKPVYKIRKNDWIFIKK